jgi:hypothetical protein
MKINRMQNEQIKKGIEEIQNIQMTYHERETVFKNIVNSSAKTERPVRSPYSFLLKKNYFVYSLVVLFFLVALGGGKTFFTNIKNQNNPTLQNIANKETVNDSNNQKIAQTEKEENSASFDGKGSSQPTGNILVPKSGISVSSLPSVTINKGESEKYTKIAYDSFDKWLKQLIIEKGNVLDSKINKIDFIASKENTKEPEKSYFNSEDSKNAFIVIVDYSVEVTPEGKKGYWMALGGKTNENEWLNNSLYVTLDKNKDGYYVKSAGTGP